VGLYKRPNSPYWWAEIEGTAPPGGYNIRLSLKVPIEGATVQQTREFKKLAEQAYKAELANVVRLKLGLTVVPVERRTFAQQAEWYQTHETAKHKGKQRELRIIARLRRTFDAIALEDLVPARWTEYTTERLNEGVALATVGRELAVAKLVLGSAVGEHNDTNPLAGVKRKQPKLKPKRTVTGKEEPAFMAALKAIDPEIHDMYVVGVGTLLRRESLLELRRSAHRGDRIVVNTKTGPHQIPLYGPTELQRRAAKVLKQRMPDDPNGYFFPTWQAKFAEYADKGHPGVLFLKKVKRAAKRAGLPWGLEQDGIVWHTATRASGATRLMREFRLDVKTVQFLGNWASLDQMSEYLGIEREALFSDTLRTRQEKPAKMPAKRPKVAASRARKPATPKTSYIRRTRRAKSA
jgi:integrase